MDSHDICIDNGNEHYVQAIKQTQKYYYRHQGSIIFRNWTKCCCYPKARDRQLRHEQSIHFRMVWKFAEDDPTDCWGNGHETN